MLRHFRKNRSESFVCKSDNHFFYGTVFLLQLCEQVDGILNRLHVALPAPRDARPRPPVIPPAVLAKRELKEQRESRKRKLEREIEVEMGDDYVLGKSNGFTMLSIRISNITFSKATLQYAD